MDAHKLQVKLFAEAGHGLAPEAFIPIFHRWIKDHVLPELMIDVANYGHVPKGPGVVLIGHACDYFIDDAEGRFGLLHNRKRSEPAPADRLPDAFRRALHAAWLLEQEPSLAGKLRFRTDELSLRINDRLAAPQGAATFAAVRPEVEAACARLYGGGAVQLAPTTDPKALFGVKITGPASDVATLLERLGGPPPRDRSLG
jgi:hypothetical protein